MPNKKPSFPAARVKDPISVGLSIIVGGEDTVLIGGEPKPIACTDCKAKALLSKGNPVNVHLGCKFESGRVDFALPAPLPFAWQPFYASDAPFTGLLGQGWRTPVELYVEANESTTRLVDIQGRWIDFAPLDLGEEQHCPSEGIWLARGSTDRTILWDERWQWLPEQYRHDPHLIIATPGDGDYLIFEAIVKPAPTKEALHPIPAGRHDLAVLLTRHGYTTQLRWRSMHNAASQAVRVPEFITDSAGRIYRLHFTALADEHKRQWSSGHPDTDPGIRLSGISLAYDPLRDSAAPADLAALRDLRVSEWLVRYRYSDAGDLIEVQDGDGDTVVEYGYEQHLITRKQTLDGRDTHYEYDRHTVDGKVIRQKQAGGLDYVFVYGEHDTTVTDSLGRTMRYRFAGDAGLRRPVEITYPDGGIVKMDYTNDGQMKRLTDPLGRSTHFTHTSKGEYLGSIDPLGQRQERYLDHVTGLATGMRDGEGQTTHLERDAKGNVLQVIAPDGSKTRYEYDHPKFPDRPTAIVDARGGRKLLDYNALGQVSSATDCSGQTTHYRHDRKGRLLAVENAVGQSQTYRRDRKGRIVSVTLPDGKEEAFEYDRSGRLVKAIDPDGHPVEMSYDRQGRMTEHRVWSGEKGSGSGSGSGNSATAAGPGWSVTLYTYDPAGRLTQLTNAAGAAMRFGYDAMDRLIQETGFDGKHNAYGYNLAGELTSQTEGKGEAGAITLRHEHDAGGRLIARHLPAWNGSPEQIHRFAYNRRNQLTRAETYNSQVDFTYNALGQLIAETQSSLDGFSRTLRFGYDVLGNRNQLILPDGRSIDTLMYGSGHWHQVAFDGQPLVDVERDSLHREIKRSYGSGSQHMVAHPLMRSQSYTRLGQLDTRSLTRGDKLVERHQHHYDPSGLLIRIERARHGARDITRYGYDGQQRLRAWDKHDVIPEPPSLDHPMGRDRYRQTQAETYAHDAAGNPVLPGTVIRVDPVSNMPVYTSAEQWAEVVQANAGNPAFNLLGMVPVRPNRIAQLGNVFHEEYDSRGNVVRRRTLEGKWDFTWNALNQMTASRFMPAGSSEGRYAAGYFYDAFGRRIGKLIVDLRELKQLSNGEDDPDSVGTAMIRYLSDGDRMLQEIHAHHVKTIVYEPGSFVPLAQVVQWKEAEEPSTVSAEERQRRWMEQHNLTMLMAQGAASPELMQALREQLRGDGGQEEWALHLFLTDQLGTPYRMVDAQTHAMVWQREAGPWGKTIEETVSEALPDACHPNIGFQGQQRDWETGLFYNRHRYYDPLMRRYLGQDPTGLIGGQNLYQYPLNPTQEIDPLGLFMEAIYGRTDRVLTVKDDNGNWHTFDNTADIFSGTSSDPCAVDRGTLPAGEYYIEQGKYRAPTSHWHEGGVWYQLHAKNSAGKLSYDNVPAKGADGKDCKRGQFNIHAGTGSNGCVTFGADRSSKSYNEKNVTTPEFERLRKLLDSTPTKNMGGSKYVGKLKVIP